MKKGIAVALIVGASAAAFAQQAGNRGSFVQQQAYDEMRRVAGQVDVIQTNLDDLQQKVRRLESGNGGADRDMKAEIESLKSSVAELRRQMARQREEIVQDLTARLSKMQKQMTPPPAPKPVVTTKTIEVGPHKEYVVQSGDTLSLVAQAFGTTVAKIKEMNGLKNNNLRVGQKLMVPKD